MRIKYNNILKLLRQEIEFDDEANEFLNYSFEREIEAHVFFKKNFLKLEMYGERINNILNAFIEVEEAVELGDIIEIDSKKYKVINLMKYTQHKELEMELIQ